MRWACAVESASDLAAGAAIAAFVPSSKAISLRRLVVGGRGATEEGNVTAAVTYLEARGDAGANPVFHMQPIGIGQSLGDNGTLGLVWGLFDSDPEPQATPLYELSFNAAGGSEKLKWGEGEFTVLPDLVNGNAGIMLYTVDAVPAGFLFTVSFEVSEF